MFVISLIAGGVNGQQQYFRIPPTDIEVAIGQTAVISCEVGNREGRVQWTKDGLTLGKSMETHKIKVQINECLGVTLIWLHSQYFPFLIWVHNPLQLPLPTICTCSKLPLLIYCLEVSPRDHFMNKYKSILLYFQSTQTMATNELIQFVVVKEVLCFLCKVHLISHKLITEYTLME